MPTTAQWALGYARQARSDMLVRDYLLLAGDVPACHELHFLQMACEKLCKAQLYADGDDNPALQKSHGYAARVLPLIFKMQFSACYRRAPHRRAKVLKEAYHLAREIELLSPAMDDAGKRRDNCEYPWDDASGNVLVPIDRDFTNLDMLNRPNGRQLVAFVKAAIDDLCQSSNPATDGTA